MAVLRWIGRVPATLMVWLGKMVAWVSPGAAAGCYVVAWWLGGDGETASLALSATAGAYSESVALARAVHWMKTRPHPAIAAFGGLLALQGGEADLAARFLEQGKALGTDRDGHLELLEWLLTTSTGDGSAVEQLARQLEQRRDLSPLLSRQVLTTLLWESLQHQRFDEARGRADHLLSIEDTPQAEMALWALAKRDGDIHQADLHLRRAALEPRHKLSFQILGNIAIGFLEEARALEAQLRQLDPSQARLAGQALPLRPEESA
jgi:hypothetical protein